MVKVLGLTILIFAFILTCANGQGGIPGGLGDARPADDRVNQLVARLTPDIIKAICDHNKENCPPSDVKITVNSYKSQVVAGANYYISITVGEELYHVRIFTQPWTKTEQVHKVQGPKQVTDEITFF